MFARMTSCQTEAHMTPEALALFMESVLPVARSQQGYQGVSYLHDPRTGKIMIVTYWNSIEDAILNEESGYYQDQLDKFKALFTVVPQRDGLEVGFRE